MLLGRRFDERCVNLQRRGLMVTLAPAIGQEACSVGSVLPLDPAQTGSFLSTAKPLDSSFTGSRSSRRSSGTWAVHLDS